MKKKSMIKLPPMAQYFGHIAHNEIWWVQRAHPLWVLGYQPNPLALVVDFQLAIVIKSHSNMHANHNAIVRLRMGIIYSNSHPTYHVVTYPNHMWGPMNNYLPLPTSKKTLKK